MKNIIEVLKTNKKRIVKSVLIAGGTGVALAVVAKMLNTSEEDDDDYTLADEDRTVVDAEVIEE